MSATKLASVRAVIFDLDGTLVDSNWLHLRSWRIALERLGLSAPDHEIVDRFGLKTVDIARAVASAYGDQTVTKLVELKSQLFEGAWPRELKTQEGALKILGMIRAKGLLSGVASSNTTERTLSIVQHFRMDSLLDVVVGIEEVEAGKPDPALVRAAINKLAVTPKESIYVGDSKYDIEAGRAAGTRTVLIVQPIAAQSNLQVEPDYRVKHLDELQGIIWPRDGELK